MTRRMTLAVVGVAWGALAALGAAAASGLHLNSTSSMPQGMWLERPYTGAVRTGDAVVVCLPATEQTRRYIGPGTCPNGLEPLLKTVGAVPGDVVTLPLPGYAPLAADAAGRPLTAYPAGTYRVQPGQVFLFSEHDVRSYDSRYFGPVETRSIIAAGKPVWTLQ